MMTSLRTGLLLATLLSTSNALAEDPPKPLDSKVSDFSKAKTSVDPKAKADQKAKADADAKAKSDADAKAKKEADSK